MKWQVDEIVNWLNGKLMNWQDDDMGSSSNEKLMKWKLDEMAIWQKKNGNLMNLSIWWKAK